MVQREDVAYSQNDLELSSSLSELLDDLRKTSDYLYFRTEHAREKNSFASRLV
jgi:hypothetical protein